MLAGFITKGGFQFITDALSLAGLGAILGRIYSQGITRRGIYNYEKI